MLKQKLFFWIDFVFISILGSELFIRSSYVDKSLDINLYVK